MLFLVVARGNFLEQAVLGGVDITEREEAGRPVEEEPWDAEARGHVACLMWSDANEALNRAKSLLNLFSWFLTGTVVRTRHLIL
jgi:hypothetical protein